MILVEGLNVQEVWIGKGYCFVCGETLWTLSVVWSGLGP